jgi:hypothetical protein
VELSGTAWGLPAARPGDGGPGDCTGPDDDGRSAAGTGNGLVLIVVVGGAPVGASMLGLLADLWGIRAAHMVGGMLIAGVAGLLAVVVREVPRRGVQRRDERPIGRSIMSVPTARFFLVWLRYRQQGKWLIMVVDDSPGVLPRRYAGEPIQLHSGPTPQQVEHDAAKRAADVLAGRIGAASTCRNSRSAHCWS